jgi:cytochrome c oxidase assembly protein subunit 15
MAGLAALGASQGLVGWWMVKSGLGDDRRADTNQIRVRPVRLAAHLSMAFVTYGALLWTGWDVLNLQQYAKTNLQNDLATMSKEALRHASRLRIGATAIAGLTALTVVSGALVAGNDAGRAYNVWPKMTDQDWIASEVYAGDKHLLKKMSEDTATVQFNHRIMGEITGLAAIGLVALSKPHLLTPQVRNGIYAVGVTTTAQMTLGIVTLLNYAPIGLAAIHQLGSVAVFTSGLYLMHSLRYVRPATVQNLATSFAKVIPK